MNVNILVSTSVLFRPMTVQVLNLALTWHETDNCVVREILVRTFLQLLVLVAQAGFTHITTQITWILVRKFLMWNSVTRSTGTVNSLCFCVCLSNVYGWLCAVSEETGRTTSNPRISDSGQCKRISPRKLREKIRTTFIQKKLRKNIYLVEMRKISGSIQYLHGENIAC